MKNEKPRWRKAQRGFDKGCQQMAITAVVPPGVGNDDGGDGALRNAWLTPKTLGAG